MMGSAPAAGGGRGGLSGYLLVGLFAAVVLLVFVGVYLVFPADYHFYALIVMGILALLVALGSYVAQAATRDPSIARAGTWGFGIFGFVLLFVSVLAWPAIYPNSAPLTGVGEIVVLVLLLLLAIGAVIGARWRMGQHVVEAHRQEARSEWASRPAPSAFSYATAQVPSNPSPPPPAGGAPPPGGK